MLTRKLTNEEKQDLLQTLFGFDLVNVSDIGMAEHWVVYDDDGNEFYGSDENCQFDFSTLSGFFRYVAFRANARGRFDTQFEIKKALGIV
jgi:hypothetical protein